jgi:hypothetical protein
MKIKYIFLTFFCFLNIGYAEDIYLLATKVAKIKEVKDIIRHERKLFSAIRRYYVDIGEWPEDSNNGDYGTLNDYIASDSDEIFSNTIYGRVLDYTIDRNNKIVTISGGDVGLDDEQLLIYRARVEARDSDRNATFLFEKLDRKGLIGAQKKYIVLPTPPANNQATTYPDGTIGYSHYKFNGIDRWKKYIVRTIKINGIDTRVWIEENL